MSIKCDHCLKQAAKHNLDINNRTFKGLFDSLEFTINLCDDCFKKLGVRHKWFDTNNVRYCDSDDLKFYEFKIIGLINKLPITSQEQLLNKPNSKCPFAMDREDWINTYKDGYFNI